MAKKSLSDTIVDAIRKKVGDDAAELMSTTSSGVQAVCPTGLTVLDRYVLGIGGLPYGHVIEIFGGESSGKSTILSAMLGGVQRDGGTAVICDNEHSWEPAWAAKHGASLDSGIVQLRNATCLDGEHGFLRRAEIAIEAAKGRPLLVALDTIAATPTEKELNENLAEGAAMAESARIWSTGLRKLTQLMSGTRAVLVLVNQTRAVIGNMYGPKTTTPGGNAIKFYAAVRLLVSHGKKAGECARYLGVMAVKNKVCPPGRKAQFLLDFHAGFNDRWSVLNHAKEMGCVSNKCRSYKEAVKALNWDDLTPAATDDGMEESLTGAAQEGYADAE